MTLLTPFQIKTRLTGASRCFLIGNGPSTKRQDLTLLRNEHVFVCNNIGVVPMSHLDSPPLFYFWGDPALVNKSGFTGHEGFYTTVYKNYPYSIYVTTSDIFRLFSQYVPGAKVCLVPLMNNFPWHSSNIDFVSLLNSFHLPGVQSVSQMMMGFALAMGYKEIYLLGMDHNWFQVFNIWKGDAPHRYAETVVENELLPVIKSRPGFEAMPSFYQEICSQKILYEGYYNILRAADELGVKIMNATDGGMLDVFERCDYKTLW